MPDFYFGFAYAKFLYTEVLLRSNNDQNIRIEVDAFYEFILNILWE